MTYNSIKQKFSDDNYLIDNSFALLQSISALINAKKNEDRGRELLIRVLDKIEHFKDHSDIVYSLIRSVGLFPYLKSDGNGLSAIDAFTYEMHRPANIDGEFVFHSMQFKIYQELLNSKNIVLSASTSVGKSLIIDALIASRKFKTIVLVVPTIALIDETRHRVTRRFKKECKIITHPSQSKSDKLINIYILTQERVIERTDLENIDIFVIDEFYKLDFKMSEDDRAIALNLALYKLLQESKQFFLIGPNIDYVNDLSKLGFSFLFIPSTFSTVAVNLISFDFRTQDEARGKKLIEICTEADSPVLIYCQSPTSVNKIASLMLSENNILTYPTDISDALEWIERHYSKEWIFYKALKSGIGIHHGGIPRSLQQYCLSKFNDKTLKYLVCTSTIIEGVNTVAKNVIVYDKRRNTRLLDYFTYKNIEGRAGRMGQYFVGNVYSLETPPDKEVSQVDIAIASQGDTTPVNLLLNMNDEDLTEKSRDRIRLELHEDILSTKIVKSNLSYPPEIQYKLALYIKDNLDHFKDVFDWKSFPTNEQLKEVCVLIFDFLEGSRLKNYGILSGSDLDRHVKMLMMSEGIDGYMLGRISNEIIANISETIENSLKIVRNVFCFSFPRALRSLDSIQKEILSKNGLTDTGDFNNYASNVESLKMNANLFALDEFGIPLQTVDKIKDRLANAQDLDDCLLLLQSLSYSDLNLLNFEKEIIEKFKKDNIGG